MLYYLFNFLEQCDFPGARMFGYVSFRSLMAVILSLLISAIFGEYFINLLKRKQITETQRDASIDPFNVKKVGVPTMGGIIIIVAILIPCLLLGKLDNIYMILMLITTVWLGTLGFLDDYIKVFRKDKEGLHGKFKIIGQVGLGLIVGLTLYLSPNVVIRENVEIQKGGEIVEIVHKAQNEKSTKTTIPFFKNNNLDYADFVGFLGDHAQTAGWILFVLVTIFVVTAVSNGANLNDGMDGMAAGNSAIIGLTLGILAYVSSHIEYAEYLNIMYIPGSEELVIFICAFIGALIGFLWYNAFPAQVFMGDTDYSISCTITNNGPVAGKEVVQLYISAPGKSMDKPAKELRGFVKTQLLQPGESREIIFKVKDTDLASFDESASHWVVESGKYEAQIGSSADDIRLRDSFNVKGRVTEKVHAVLLPGERIDLLKR